MSHGWTRINTDGDKEVRNQKTGARASAFILSVFICVNPWLNICVVNLNDARL
jgi:hypothetical protein